VGANGACVRAGRGADDSNTLLAAPKQKKAKPAKKKRAKPAAPERSVAAQREREVGAGGRGQRTAPGHAHTERLTCTRTVIPERNAAAAEDPAEEAGKAEGRARARALALGQRALTLARPPQTEREAKQLRARLYDSLT
jgi:hypothetical protein